MQQIQSSVVPGFSARPDAPTAAGGQPAANAGGGGAGAFQNLLLDALLGGRAGPGVAAQGPAAATQLLPTVTGAAPVPVSGPGGGEGAQVAAGGKATGGKATGGTAGAAPTAGMPDAVPDDQDPVTAFAALFAASGRAPGGSGGGSTKRQTGSSTEQPAPVMAAGAVQTQLVQALALMAQVTGTQGAAVPAAAAADGSRSGQTPATAVGSQAGQLSDAQLEAFVQRAAQTVSGGQAPAGAQSQSEQPSAGPSFADLVQLVVNAEQAGGAVQGTTSAGQQGKNQTSALAQEPAPAQPQAPAQGQIPAQGQAPAQSQAQAQAHKQTQTQAPAPAQSQTPAPAKPPTQVQAIAQPQPDSQQAPAPVAARLKAEKQVDAPDTTTQPNLAAAHPIQQDAVPTADAAQTAPQTPVDPEQVLRQVTRFVKVMIDSKQSEVRLQLHPENLGAVAVKLIVGEGAIRANLVAGDAAVKAALEANLDQLKSRLAGQGFQVEQVHVTVGGDGGFGQPQHSRQGEQRQPQQQQWRPQQPWASQTEDESMPGLRSRRPVPAWLTRGSGARLDSLA